MFVVVSYDVMDDKRRLKVSRKLEDYGRRVQYSVFECILERDRIKRLIETINKLIDKQEDSVRIYQLCDVCLKKTKVYGVGRITEDEEMFIV